jgi:hypothetical protein
MLFSFEIAGIKKCDKKKNLDKSDNKKKFDKLEESAKSRWDKIIEYMLSIVKESDIENRSIIELLERAKYVDRKQ